MTAPPYVIWKPFYSVGNPRLDAEHRQIIDAINELFSVMQQGEDRAILKPLFDRLVRYTDEHFHAEERIMRNHDFPKIAEHKDLHDKMRRKTRDLQTNVGELSGREVLAFLKGWWINHIQSRDKQYSPYLQVPAQS